MLTVISIIFGFLLFGIFPIAIIFGLIGLWIFGFWGAFIGVIVGMGIR